MSDDFTIATLRPAQRRTLTVLAVLAAVQVAYYMWAYQRTSGGTLLMSPGWPRPFPWPDSWIDPLIDWYLTPYQPVWCFEAYPFQLMMLGLMAVPLTVLTASLTVLVMPTYQRSRALAQSPSGFCSTCGYDLRGSVSPTCPECGEGKPAQSGNQTPRWYERWLARLPRGTGVATVSMPIFMLVSIAVVLIGRDFALLGPHNLLQALVGKACWYAASYGLTYLGAPMGVAYAAIILATMLVLAVNLRRLTRAMASMRITIDGENIRVEFGRSLSTK